MSAVALLGTDRWARAANALTMIRLLGSPLLAWLILRDNPSWLSVVIALFLGWTDYLDGKIARRSLPTRLGAFMDPLADKLVILLSSYVLVSVEVFDLLPVVLITVREVVIQLYRSYWARYGLAVPARSSAKYKAFVQGLAVLAGVCPWLETHTSLIAVVLWVAVVFTVVSGLQYMFDGRNALRSSGQR